MPFPPGALEAFDLDVAGGVILAREILIGAEPAAVAKSQIANLAGGARRLLRESECAAERVVRFVMWIAAFIKSFPFGKLGPFVRDPGRHPTLDCGIITMDE